MPPSDRPAGAARGGFSLRHRLLLGLCLPVAVFMVVDSWASYHAALGTAQRAFDRLLVTSAHALADLIHLEQGQLQISLPHAALELYDSDQGGERQPEEATRSRMIYRVSYLDGAYLAGDSALEPYRGVAAVHPRYGARLALYDTLQGGEPLRIAALWQPVETEEGLRYVVVQVGEPSAYRDRIAQGILWQTLGRQALLLVVLLALVWAAITVALRPLRVFARGLEARPASNLDPLMVVPQTPRELLPLVNAFNRLLGLAGRAQALQQVAATTRRTSRVVQQLLTWNRARADVSAGQIETVDLVALVEEVAIELSPLISARHQDLQFDPAPCRWTGPAWMVREILVNLLHNALHYTPEGGALGIRMAVEPGGVALTVHDDGPGIAEPLLQNLFVPFVGGDPHRQGTGLGLAICHEMAQACGGRLEVANRLREGRAAGLNATLWLPTNP